MRLTVSFLSISKPLGCHHQVNYKSDYKYRSCYKGCYYQITISCSICRNNNLCFFIRVEFYSKYMQLHDYLLGAMSLVDSVMDIQFPPQNYIRMGTDPNVSQNLPFGVMDSRLIFRLKVIRPFINMVEIPRQVMFTVYVTSTPYDPLVTPVYTISFGGRVEVPQNCELNAGQIVEFDFGDIGASLFSAAGPGNRPAGVMPQTKSIAVKCTNVAAQAYLTMRLEASAVSGQAMVSDNQDLGFIVADQNDTPITPNDLNSVIPFRLDAAAAANVTLRAWPISITGQKPTEGPFSALGYLRVDYQ